MPQAINDRASILKSRSLSLEYLNAGWLYRNESIAEKGRDFFGIHEGLQQQSSGRRSSKVSSSTRRNSSWQLGSKVSFEHEGSEFERPHEFSRSLDYWEVWVSPSIG